MGKRERTGLRIARVHTELSISELPFASVSKRVYVQNHSYENVFYPHVHFHANQINFHMNGSARRLVLKLRQKATRKWPIATTFQ